ncbi:MAG: hydantoinase B/oxoprolinase family protein [Pseudomonadota bacterium]|nr:hydantoinase B/oxoprolinase family protein [Pseudomonadota bacterium]
MTRPDTKPNKDPLSPIRMQIMWDRLIAVVEEQALTLIRTGFSTSTREAGDLSAGIFDISGDMLAQAITGTPGHVNSMARSVKHFLERFSVQEMLDGDVFLTNDPWKGTGHLHDFTFLTPCFLSGRLVALFASTCHVVDIGGRGMTSDGRTIYEEGLYIPLMRFAHAGKTDQTLIDIVTANVREPVQVLGDLHSLATCNELACRRLCEMMEEFAISDLGLIGAHILEKSKAAAIAAIQKVPPGRYQHEMRIDGLEEPVDLVANMAVTETGIDVDFTGSSGVSSYGINVPLCYTEAYATFGVKCIVAPEVPNNAGSLSTIRITAPEGSILNATHPAPVSVRHVTGQMLPDVVFGCLHKALGNAVPAEGTSCLWNLYAFGGPGRVEANPKLLSDAQTFTVLSFHSGGTGARPGKDGLSATAFPSGVRNVPVEVTEAISPLVVWRKEFRQDSGGAGLHRGGLGQTMELGLLENVPFAFSALFDRIEHPPRGRNGGGDGAGGSVRLSSGPALNGKGTQTIPEGEKVTIDMPGGGGLGQPKMRNIALVAADVRAGLVSEAAARDLYCVVATPEGGLDELETAALRKQ